MNKMLLGWKVTMEGKTLEDHMDDPEEITCDLNTFLKNLRYRWGANSDIYFHVWRENWSA